MGKKKKNDMSFLQHVEALRWHLIRAISAIVILAIVAFFFKDFIFNKVLFAPKEPHFLTNMLMCKFSKYIGVDAICINQNPFNIINIKMTGQFMTHITVSLIAGLIVAFPFVFNEFWRFLKPALKKKEVKHSRGAVLSASMLFSLGALFGYYLIVPLSVNFLGNYNVSEDVANQINLSSYIQTFTSVILASAVVFAESSQSLQYINWSALASTVALNPLSCTVLAVPLAVAVILVCEPAVMRAASSFTI